MSASDPFKELAGLIDTRIAARAARAVSGLPCELGTITGTGLKLDSFKHEIRGYLVADWLVTLRLPAFILRGTVSGLLDGDGKAVTGEGTFSFDAAEIAGVRLKLTLQPGDRVLAVPVNGGKDAMVIAKVVGNA